MNIAQIYRLYPKESDCIAHIEAVRWRGKPVCPYCGSDRSTAMPKEQRHHCNNCKTSFSAMVKTIFHHTHLPLQKWFLALSLILNAKKGIAARQLGRDLEVNKDTAWFMAMRIRRAMEEHPDQRALLQGVVEVDETYIGGKPRKRARRADEAPHNKRGRGTKKLAVVGAVQRGGKVITRLVPNVKAKTLTQFIREHVEAEGTTVMTDEMQSYWRLSAFIRHQTVNHQVEYVSGNIHTNTLESYWALLRRGLMGQYHRLSKRYLPRYLDEFSYRYNIRKVANVFEITLARGLGA
ncbi:IS1595 family transposase [Candidatus Binatus sp.]|uniref:IS1595 family transposase n=1 Tax=Candidatus Binatus sp. TaxID=2811406 RepID=UPI002F921002